LYLLYYSIFIGFEKVDKNYDFNNNLLMQVNKMICDSLLPHETISGKSVRNVVRKTPLIIKLSHKYDQINLVILNNKGEGVQNIELIIEEDHVEITIDELSKGKSYFIVQLKSNGETIHEEYVKCITEHLAIQLLRKETKKVKNCHTQK
jgi:hypothetical protein